MNFRDVILKHSYETGKNDLLGDFYIPMLSLSTKYDRISGFFSSTSLALAASGLAGLIEHGGTMRLVTCPKMSKEDATMIENSLSSTDGVLGLSMSSELDNLANEFQQDHVSALGWMLAKGYLKIKIALVYDNKGNLIYDQQQLSKSIMHQKVGILYDEAFNGVSFSGSNNESASGWLDNIEEFKVFRQWEPGQKEYFNGDVAKFDEFWNNRRVGTKVVDLPTAVEEKLIQIGTDFDIERISLNKYYTSKVWNTKKPSAGEKEKEKKEVLKLFTYQEEAVKKWSENNRQLLFEMATGCGKTRTAIACMNEIAKDKSTPTIFVVACPQDTLSIQWKKQIEELDTSIGPGLVCDGSYPNWRVDIRKAISKLIMGRTTNIVLYATHKTAASEDFINLLNTSSSKIRRFLIGDEVHGMGAPKMRAGLLDSYQYRLGLSATPSRWFDDEGSAFISKYFGNDSYVYSIEDALVNINPSTGKPYLVNYNYYPRFIPLTDEELKRYQDFSKIIKKLSRIRTEEIEKKIEKIRFERADIEKSAENKYPELERILNEVGDDIGDTILFVSDMQIDRVMAILGKRKIAAHKYTQKEGTSPDSRFGGISEREYIIEKFKKGNFKVLVAIKCLDEGIDIPSAKRAIVMASSTNPREYIQRIGRVIRQAEGKTQAEIYDLIIHPGTTGFKDEEFCMLEKSIFEKEMVRVKDLSKYSLNNAQVLNSIYDELRRT